MSYRIDIPQHKHPKHRSVAKISTPERVDIDNGSTFNAAYPQWYLEQKMPKRVDVKAHKDAMRLHHCAYWSPYRHYCMHHCNFGLNCTDDHCRRCKHYLDMSKVIPIHLRQEYVEFNEDEERVGTITTEVHFEKKDDGSLVLPGVTATTSIDPIPWDYVIRVHFNANVPEAQVEPQSTRYALVFKYTSDTEDISTVVHKGRIIVHPAIL